MEGSPAPPGLMQDVPLTLDLVLRRIERLGAEVHVASAFRDGVVRHSWQEIAQRSRRVVTLLDELGVPAGACVATLAWNSHRHLELFYGVPCSGRVLHTLNARLSPALLATQLERRGDAAIFVDASLSDLLAEVLECCDCRHVPPVVVLEDRPEVAAPFARAPRYESLLAVALPAVELGPMSEGQALCIGHTSGTTSAPKAVVYSHRSVVLHALGALSSDHHGVSRGAVVMPLTPMFHLMAWGLPYSSGLAPAGLVLAGADTSPQALARLIERERVTLAAGIPTFWVRLIDAIEDPSRDLSSLRRVLSGGASAPPALVERYLAAGVEFVSSWGMTEANSGTTSRFSDAGSAASGVHQGAPIAGVELRIVGEDGGELQWDGSAVGELEARGPWIARAYLDLEDDANERSFHEGWLRTGDLARIDPAGNIEIVDRLKDLIKSGGEWISSTELESRLVGEAGVKEAAVIAIPDELYGERPLAVLVAEDGAELDPQTLRTALLAAVPGWWVPERIELTAELPKTSVGKYDKRALRALYASGADAAGGSDAAPATNSQARAE